jgi:hypothetical protein
MFEENIISVGEKGMACRFQGELNRERGIADTMDRRHH